MQAGDAGRLTNLRRLLIVQGDHLRRVVQSINPANRAQRVVNYVERVGILFNCPALVGLIVFEGLEATVLASLLLAPIQLVLLGLHLCKNELLLLLNLLGDHPHVQETIPEAHPGVLDA